MTKTARANTDEDRGLAGIPWAVGELGKALKLYKGLLLGQTKHFLLLIGVVLVGAVLEALGIALVMPLIASLQGVEATGLLWQLLPSSLARGSIVRIAGLVLLVFVAKNAITLFRTRWSVLFFNRLWRQWVQRIVDHLLYRQEALPSDLKAGEIVSVAISETKDCANSLLNLVLFIVSGLTFLGIYAVLWLGSWRGTLVLTSLFVAFALFGLRPLTGRAHGAGRRLVESSEAASSMLIETVIGRRDIVAFGKEDYFASRMKEPLSDIQNSLVSIQWLSNIVHPTIETVAVVCFCTVLFLLSETAQGAVNQQLPVLAVFAAAAFRLFPVLSVIGAQWVAVISRQAPARRVLRLMGTEEPGTEGGKEIQALKTHLGFRGVSFYYPGRAEAVSDASFEVRSGERVALAGESGSGKSTLVSLLMGFQTPSSGTIEIDGTALRDLRMESWRSLTGYVGQESSVFNMTLEDNISLGRIPRGDPRVREVAEAVHLDEVVKSLPQRYQTKVGERGLQLSGGQRQRVLLARALLMKPQVLVLDEALSALDNESIAQLLRDMRAFLPRATWVVVAHRLSPVTEFDEIVVLKGGRIVERGRHEILMDEGGYYRQLFELELAGRNST